ncbi:MULTISPECIES: hypothetical protein [Cytobacillus]|uniref:hypothetical protein n=1 Tax=Cytobacillus TaxID=2675230 RepID=UPI00135695B7|nr:MULTISPECIES: hypothetical protein [Cytobacillus]KAF0815528.1 hypothetical protein KIS4809_5723 [Bacillus sp. ZZV12-4809]MCM3094499.1 hypothetical protein [Cytobacillus sp. AMY 15.2]URT71604.1 hypothetical protein NAF01_03810 [Cytobacillus firmus]
MFRKGIILIFVALFQFNLSTVNAQGNNIAKLFDIEKNQIIKTTPTNSNVQLETEKIIKGIDGVVKKFEPIPNQGYMVKIPLEPSYLLENKWINTLIDEIIIIIPKQEDPYLVTFDDENNPYFFTFNTKIDSLLNTLEFSL